MAVVILTVSVLELGSKRKQEPEKASARRPLECGVGDGDVRVAGVPGAIRGQRPA